MIIEPVEHIPGLYLVQQVYNLQLLDQFLDENIETVHHRSLPMQEHWLRKNYKLFPAGSTWHVLQNNVDWTAVNSMGWYKYSSLDTAYWIDLPGFSTGMHQDNAQVQASLQVYLDTADNMGTQFQHNNEVFTVPYQKNTGYMMINCGQIHGYPGPAPKHRYSTYTWLKPKS